MPLTAGTRLGPYEICNAIGAGGMGEVYRARDTKLQRDVAVKVLPDDVAADPDRLARFEREARALAALNHPNIAAVYAVENPSSGSTQTSAIVMELVEGADLSARIKNGPIPLNEALAIARQIAQALEAAHERDIVHRDLKPANIKLRDDDTVKVLDFGLAKALEPPGEPGVETMNSPTLTARATRLGVILGTAAYMAPEQAKGKAVDKRADVWAFGVVLFEMLAGRRPFDGDDDVTEVLAAVVRAAPQWSALPADTPPLIRRLLQRCLTKDVKQRLHDIADARLEIEETLNPQLVAGAAGPQATGQTSTRRAAIRALVLSAGAVGCLAVGAWIQHATSSDESVSTSVSFPLSPPPGWTLGLSGGTLTQTSRPQMAVSPDGSRVVFRAYQPGRGLLFLRSLANTNVDPVEGTEGANYPAWSPDGSRILFCQGGQLKHIPAGGGPAQVLGPCVNPRTAAAWAPGDAILAAGTYQGPLYARIRGEWREVLPATYKSDECFYLTPAWLPDAEHYLVVKWGTASEATVRACQGLYVGAIGSPKLTRLIDGPVESVAVVGDAVSFLQGGELTLQAFDHATRTLVDQPRVLANDVVSFSAAGRTVAYAARSGVKPHRFAVGNRIAWYQRDGTGPVYTGGLGTYGDPSISPNNRSVLVSLLEASGRLRLVDFDIQSDAPNPLAWGTFGIWSPNGDQLAVQHGGAGIALLNLLDNKQETLGGDALSPWDWSRDGKWIVGSGLKAIAVGDSRVVPLESGGQRAAISPDQKWIAFDLDSRIYVAPFPGPGPRLSVSNLTGTTARWGPGGKELYFATSAVEGQRSIVAVPVIASGSSIRFDPPDPILKVPLLERNWAYDVTSDGKRFVFIVAGEPDRVTLTVTVGLR